MGIIPMVKSSSVSLLMMSSGTNMTIGNVINPYHIDKNSGGSSSGEGVLVSTNCVAFGIGTDIGGSIRIPAAYCGCFG